MGMMSPNGGQAWLHVLAAAWLAGAAWGSWPVHQAGPLETAALYVVSLGTPVAFAAFSWLGWRRKSRSLAVAWPAACLATMLLVSPLAGAYLWGPQAIPAILSRWSWGFTAYLLICAAAYLAAMFAARRNLAPKAPPR